LPTQVDPNWMRLQDLYILRNDERLHALIRANPDLSTLAIAAHKFCVKHFPTATPILEAASDPEAEGIPDDLFIVLQTELSVEEASERLDQLDLDWALSKTDTKSMIIFTLEFL
jgi:hypothetical protein